VTALLECFDRFSETMRKGGGVFIGFKNCLKLSEVTILTPIVSDSEMIWGKLLLHNQKPLHICSLYRPPDSPVTNLKNCLSQLFTIDPDNSLCILIGGDFNFPGISWQDGYAHINPSPTYGIGINQHFVDTINDHGLEQFISISTRGNNVLDLLFCSYPYFISNVETTPGISDHDAILYSLNLSNKPFSDIKN